MDNSTLLLGIDIGWSENSRSCALAAFDPQQKISWPKRVSDYDHSKLACCRFRLSELLEFIRSLSDATKQYETLIVVLDGPLGPNGRPEINRTVDSLFRCGEFKNRMQPSDVQNDAGQVYVDATYQVAEAFSESFDLWMGGDKERVLITETNPTVGLALMNKKFCPKDLPSRKQPLVPPSGPTGGIAIRAKSDFYWRAGANQICSLICSCPNLASEMHHENVAGLYCLAVAVAICSGKEIVAGHTDDGVYVFPNQVHTDWHDDLEKLGIVKGNVSDLPTSIQNYDFSSWKRHSVGVGSDGGSNATKVECESDLLDACKGDSTVLLLNDNGGVQEKHNSWLEGLREPVTIRLVEKGRTAILERAATHATSRQWTISCDGNKRKANGIAKLYGLDVAHLSNEKHIAIDVEIAEVGK